MKRQINSEHIEGYLYSHELSIKTVQNQASRNYGKQFISGNLNVATDEEGLNVVSIHFTFVTEYTKNNTKNNTYAALKEIIETDNSWLLNGKDGAAKLKIDTAIGLNEFYNVQDNLVSTKTNEGGFVSIVKSITPSAKFEADMVIDNIKTNDKDNSIILNGTIFDFMNRAMPVDFIVKNPKGVQYFSNADISKKEPLYTKVWGNVNCATVTVKQTEESAFGEAAVKVYERKTKEWEVTGAATIPYAFDDENTLTREELRAAYQERELRLADMKSRVEEYRERRRAADNTPSGGFDVNSMNSPFEF